MEKIKLNLLMNSLKIVMKDINTSSTAQSVSGTLLTCYRVTAVRIIFASNASKTSKKLS